MRSQLALEVGLVIYAMGGAVLLVRLVLLLLGVDDRIWVGATIYRLTDSLVWLLTLLPGANRELLGRASLADLTAVAALVLVPLVVLARDRPR
jgi:hypothetical protein